VPIIPEVQTSYVTQDLLEKPKHEMTLTWEVRRKLLNSEKLRRDIMYKVR